MSSIKKSHHFVYFCCFRCSALPLATDRKKIFLFSNWNTIPKTHPVITILLKTICLTLCVLKTVERYKYVRQMGRGRGVRVDRKGGVGCEGGQMGRNGGCDVDSWGGVGV